MDIIKLKNLVNKLAFAETLGASDNELISELVEFLYDESGGNLLSYFMIIDKLNKEKVKKENMILYRGLEDAMHMSSAFSKLIEENNIKKLKNYFEIYFEPNDGNIAFIINIMKAYFPDGKSQGASSSGHYFFEKGKELILKHKDKYLNGDSSEWAKSQNHYDYIKMFIEVNGNS